MSSDTTGHSAGGARILLGVGLAFLFIGILFLAWAIIDGFSEEFGESNALIPLAIGSACVVIGLLVAAGGAAWSRRDAGE